MQTQELLSTILAPTQPTDWLLSTIAALILCRQGPFDTVCDLANRVCDRYLPQARGS